MPYRKTVSRKSEKTNQGTRPKKTTRLRNRNRKKGGFFGLSMGSGSLKKQAKRVSFAAKLAAFVLENHKGDKVEFAIKGGFADDQKYIFGILPFLHLNITKDQFREMLKRGQGAEVAFLTEICNSNQAAQSINPIVGFSCEPQSRTGVKTGVINSVVSNITSNSKWISRKKGRKILSQIKKNMGIQVKQGLITEASLKWSKHFK